MKIKNPPLITLTTDFGDRDGFVGAMEGVILSLLPDARVVDVSHQIPRQDIAAGALVIAGVFEYFPLGSIHVVVVDPGVGTARSAMVARTARGMLVLPDNGLITLVARRFPILAAHVIENPAYGLPVVSHTFHGRDVFAPAAAHLALGVPLSQFGRPLAAPVRLNWETPSRVEAGLAGKVVYCDVFGNVLLNFEASRLTLPGRYRLLFKGRALEGPRTTYASVARGDALFLIGSHGYLEIAVNGGSARERLGLEIGDPVLLEIPVGKQKPPGDRRKNGD